MTILEQHVSPDNLLRLVVQRDDKGNVAVGFDGFHWCIGAGALAERFGLPADQAIRAFVDDITSDHRVLAIARAGGPGNPVSRVWPTQDARGEFSHKGENEFLEFRLWSGAIA